jgi:hypothetical protein
MACLSTTLTLAGEPFGLCAQAHSRFSRPAIPLSLKFTGGTRSVPLKTGALQTLQLSPLETQSAVDAICNACRSEKPRKTRLRLKFIRISDIGRQYRYERRQP